MKRVFDISGNYTTDQKAALVDYIELFRGCIADDDPEKNILNGKMKQYTDDRVVFFLNRALKDLNSGTPRCNYSLFNFPDDDLLVSGAIVFALMAEGLLQLRNQVNFNDSGLSINMFDKTGQYQGWVSFLLQAYLQDKAEFKAGVIPTSYNSGFLGIGSEFGYDGW
jgi:hypothetical protein